ncbi:MAG: LytTR family DNA-binding domain-containing protein [Pseudomonadota bacterium]
MPIALIVEDEPLLRAELRDQLAQLWPELEIAAQAENGIEAIRLIEALRPDIVFLDIQIAGLNGLEVARHIPETTHVVFVTAYSEYAVGAFEAGAADYLVKPISAARLALTVKRLKAREGAGGKPSSAVWTKAFQGQAPAYLKWIKASLADTVRLIMVDDVLFFQSDDKYTRVVTKNAEALIRMPLKGLLEQLDPSQFVQIHRSTVVNLQAIDWIERHGTAMEIHLLGQAQRLAVSEAFMRQFKQM